MLYVDRVEPRTLAFAEEHQRWGALWDSDEFDAEAPNAHHDELDSLDQSEA